MDSLSRARLGADDVIGKRDRDLFERAEDARRIEAIKRTVLETGRDIREEGPVMHDGVEPPKVNNEARVAGFDRHLVKPVDPRTLIKIVGS